MHLDFYCWVWYNSFIDKLKNKKMETKEMSAKCCAGMGSKNKKVFFIVGGLVLSAIIVISISAAGWKIRQARNYGNMMYGKGNTQQGFGGMMNRTKGNCSVSVASDNDQFILPTDASKSGELAVVVGDLEVAKKAVFDIAEKNKGNVYKTFIAYASNNVKNGSIVVQIPADNFNSAFDELKKVGIQVVQEATEQVAPRNFYPMPLNAIEKAVPAQDSTTESVSAPEAAVTSVDEEKPEIAIYPAPSPTQFSQDKGYVKIIFVDYGAGVKVGGARKSQEFAGGVVGVGNFAGQNMRNNIIVIVGIKLIALVAIVGLLIAVFKKIFNRIRVRKENKKKVHIVRMMPKTRARVVRIAKRK